MKQNTYEIEKNIEKIKRKFHTGFLTNNIKQEVKKRLKKEEYQEYIPYNDAEKTILYTKELPKIKLFKIASPNELKHSQILGNLFALNITNEVFGDIIQYQNTFYIYLLDTISDLVTKELTRINNTKIELIEVPLDTLSNYQREYEEINLIVSSLRIDTILSKLIGTNREKIQTLIKEKQVLLNSEIITKREHILKEKDTFSIKKHGKYKFNKIIGLTKKENYIILINKYI